MSGTLSARVGASQEGRNGSSDQWGQRRLIFQNRTKAKTGIELAY